MLGIRKSTMIGERRERVTLLGVSNGRVLHYSPEYQSKISELSGKLPLKPAL